MSEIFTIPASDNGRSASQYVDFPAAEVAGIEDQYGAGIDEVLDTAVEPTQNACTFASECLLRVSCVRYGTVTEGHAQHDDGIMASLYCLNEGCDPSESFPNLIEEIADLSR